MDRGGLLRPIPVKARVQRIYKAMEQPVDVVCLLNGVEPNLDMSYFYAADLVHGGLFERSALLAWPDGKAEVVTTPLEEPLARKSPEATVTVFSTQDEKKNILLDRLKGARTIGINADETSHANVEALRKLVPDAKLVDVGDAIAKARVKKDATELARMQKAADIASAVAREIPTLVREGIKEYELAAEINYRMQKLGATGPSFQSIIAFGENSAEGHYSTADRVLRRGDFVLCDFGAFYSKYASDITRTWVFGKGSDKHREIYETVRRAQEAALAAIRPGVTGREVHKAAADVIDASPYKGRFTHGTGHSLGLSVHDSNTALFNSRSMLTLEEGMVMTVEPGIYVPGLGGVRIEDDVVVTKDGYRMLTNAPKQYVEL